MRAILTFAGALLLIVGLLPAVGAHWGPGEFAPTRPSGVTTDNVAGTVTGFAGPAVIDAQGNDLAVAGVAPCDFEVAHGQFWTRAHEAEVDENPNPLSPSIPDNVYNDGGTGGACHVGNYRNSAFNTPGCSGEARASVDGLGQPLGAYVGAVCDAGTVGGGGALGLALVAGCGKTSTGTVFVACTPPSASGGTGFVTCANDGIADATNTGYANAFAGPTIPAVTCSATSDPDGNAAAILVFAPVVDLAGDTAAPTTHVWAT